MTRHLHIDPSREPLPPDDELWGEDGMLDASDGDAAALPGTTPIDDSLDAELRALARNTYHVSDSSASRAHEPYDAAERAPRDAMWAAISARRLAVGEGAQPMPHDRQPVTVRALTPRQSKRYWPALAALAATLFAGVMIGRGFGGSGEIDTASVAAVDGGIAPRDSSGLPVMLAELTSQHFASTEALLVTARQGMSSSMTDASVAAWARDLLLSTRLLLDTDEMRDLRTRQLLQDLELTLALIVQAQSSGRDADAQTVRDDLERGDLLLRVRSAAMPTVNSTTDIRGMSE